MQQLEEIFGLIKDTPHNINYNRLRQELINLRNVINYIIEQTELSSNKDVEIIDARTSDFKNIVFGTLKQRLEAIESDNKYFWKEEHIVLEGENTITLENTYVPGMDLEIYDTTYQVRWLEEENWNISGQTITFTSLMPETLKFIIKAT